MLLLSLFKILQELGSIIFLRHGQAKNNTERVLAGRSPNVPLTENGISQAENIGKYLQSLNISAIYSSPIERAKHTADIVAKYHSLECVTDDRLIELDMGKFTGMKYEDIFANHGNVFLKFYQSDTEIAHNGVETFNEVKKRVLNMAEDISEKHKNQNVLLVTHMDPIKAMISTVWELKPQSLFELILANASLTIFNEYQGKFSLSAINVMDASRFDQEW